MSISHLSEDAASLDQASAIAKRVQHQTLDELAQQVKDHSISSTASAIAIGNAFVQAEQRLKHTDLVQWAANECGITLRSAYPFMRVARLETSEGEIVSRLNPAALFRLAASKTHPQAVKRIVEMMNLGLVPTEAEMIVLTLCLSHATVTQCSRNADRCSEP